MFIQDHEEKVFNETFEKTYADMVEKYEFDAQYDINYMREFLESMYVYQGQDWDGRGEIKSIRNNAIIGAVELVIDEIETGKLVKKESMTA